ncbi:MAG: LTA synthase family protein [Bacteroidales bacterium]|jgi:phosphoglycerol transferase MdoB-like AlkP superfamily enzyme|nr:LTA synthase family protein [Bacteroidales bacterium]
MFRTCFFDWIKRDCFIRAIYNTLLVMLLFMLCRIAFYLFNADHFPDMTFGHFVHLCRGALQFDLTAVLYTNLLYFLLMLFPVPFRANRKYQTVAKWIFIVTNSLALLANCGDMVYYRFTGRRTTISIFNEFANENNILKIIGTSIVGYWYVSLFGAVMVCLLLLLYRRPVAVKNVRANVWYYVRHTLVLPVFAVCFVIIVRGGAGVHVRPVTLSNANQYVNRANEAYIVLNTPFCVYRTIGKRSFTNPRYFNTAEELDAVFNPVVYPKPSGAFNNLNVVVFIMESFSAEYVGELNRELDGGAYRGYTPFLDSLIREGLTFEYSFANGRKSIDAMPSVLSSIPAFYEPYFLTSCSSNDVSGIAGELGKKGYYTAFFHGAPGGSMGFQAFANVSGYKDYFGMDKYDNKSDFDGTWAVWDEEFFRFFAQKMNTFRQPFMTTVFSASSHHPFRVPRKYVSRFTDKKGNHPIYKCVEYSDYALRCFFETASRMPWFGHTLFVITADHTNEMMHGEYKNDAGMYKVPIVFYQPDGRLKGRIKKIAQQTDIMPTVLGYLNYDRPFLAFGKNLLDSATVNCAMMYHKPVFQYFEGNYMYQFDEQKIISVYDFVHDIRLQHNLIREIPPTSETENRIKARMQQYAERMIANRLTVEP